MRQRGTPPPTQEVVLFEGSERYENVNVTPLRDVPEMLLVLVMKAPAKPPKCVSSVTVSWLTEQVAGAPLKHLSLPGGEATATIATKDSASAVKTMHSFFMLFSSLVGFT